MIETNLISRLNLFAYCYNSPIYVSDLDGTRPSWELRHKGGPTMYADTGTGTPNGIPVRTVTTRDGGQTTVTYFFRSKQSATSFIDRNYPRISTAISDLRDALTGPTFVLSKSISKARTFAGSPKTFYGSKALAAAGAAELVASVALGYELTVYLYNKWKENEIESLNGSVYQLKSNNIVVIVNAWDNGNICFRTGTW